MRLPALLLLASCAHAASQPVSMPTCLDIQGQRELLAGVYLEQGEQAAALARCNVRASGAEHFAQQQETRADSAESRAVWLPILTTVLGAAAAAAITAGVEAAVKR